jgi:hypothetical protein
MLLVSHRPSWLTSPKSTTKRAGTLADSSPFYATLFEKSEPEAQARTGIAISITRYM